MKNVTKMGENYATDYRRRKLRWSASSSCIYIYIYSCSCICVRRSTQIKIFNLHFQVNKTYHSSFWMWKKCVDVRSNHNYIIEVTKQSSDRRTQFIQPNLHTTAQIRRVSFVFTFNRIKFVPMFCIFHLSTLYILTMYKCVSMKVPPLRRSL